jgi:hypothetical protein
MNPASSAPLTLLRRWRAWQLVRHHPFQQQQLLPQARFLATTSGSAPTTQTPPPQTPQTQKRLSHADVVAHVAASLERLGVRPGLGCEVCDGLITVDIALHLDGEGSNGERRVAVDVTPRPADALGGGGGNEADAERGTGRPRSPQTPAGAWAMAQARRHALKAHGWHYVQLPAVEFLGAMGDAEEEEELLRRAVLAAAPEGGDHVCGSGCSH